MKDLIARLREASQGIQTWRVQDPVDGSYCIAFSRYGHGLRVLDPEREAREWLAAHADGRYASFVVAEVLVLSEKDIAMREAAAALESQAALIANVGPLCDAANEQIKHLSAELARVSAERDSLREAYQAEILKAHNLTNERDALMADARRLRDALTWYADEAKALAHHMHGGAHTDGVLASLTVLSLDGGRRADAALAPPQEPQR